MGAGQSKKELPKAVIPAKHKGSRPETEMTTTEENTNESNNSRRHAMGSWMHGTGVKRRSGRRTCSSRLRNSRGQRDMNKSFGTRDLVQQSKVLCSGKSWWGWLQVTQQREMAVSRVRIKQAENMYWAPTCSSRTVSEWELVAALASL